jgi:putative flippase GtrA
MFDWRSPKEWNTLWRYYQAGIVNTAFGYGLFALLIWLGLNLYVAQIVSHVLGMTFNYFTYSRHAFSDHTTTRTRFILSYLGNYVLGLLTLRIFVTFISSDYVAGFLATVVVSLVNFVVLKRLVFRPRDAA